MYSIIELKNTAFFLKKKKYFFRWNWSEDHRFLKIYNHKLFLEHPMKNTFFDANKTDKVLHHMNALTDTSYFLHIKKNTTEIVLS